MPKYRLIVLSGPQEGRENEYIDWCQHVHLNQVVAANGFTGAQRFHIRGALAEGETFPYLAIYDTDTDNIDAIRTGLDALAGTEQMTLSYALAPEAAAIICEEVGPEVVPASADADT